MSKTLDEMVQLAARLTEIVDSMYARRLELYGI